MRQIRHFNKTYEGPFELIYQLRIQNEDTNNVNKIMSARYDSVHRNRSKPRASMQVNICAIILG